MNFRTLKKVQGTFEKAVETGGKGELDMDAFVASFQGMLSYEGSNDRDALRHLFKRVDVNADGTIDWDEFSTFMLLENQAGWLQRTTRGADPSLTRPHFFRVFSHRALQSSGMWNLA